MKVISLSNQKGGVGKTVTAWALATGLNRKGYKVLMIDLDAQRNLSYTAGFNLLDTEHTLYNVMKRRAIFNLCVKKVKDNLDIVCGGLELSQADLEFSVTGREYMLKEILEENKVNYDYVIIDTEPHLGVVVSNALTASNSVIIPIQADMYGLQGLAQLKGFIDTIKKYNNPQLQIEGILITRLESRTNLSQAMTQMIEDKATEYGMKVFDSRIRQAVAVGESALMQADIFDTKTAVGEDYANFIKEILEKERG